MKSLRLNKWCGWVRYWGWKVWTVQSMFFSLIYIAKKVNACATGPRGTSCWWRKWCWFRDSLLQLHLPTGDSCTQFASDERKSQRERERERVSHHRFDVTQFVTLIPVLSWMWINWIINLTLTGVSVSLFFPFVFNEKFLSQMKDKLTLFSLSLPLASLKVQSHLYPWNVI